MFTLDDIGREVHSLHEYTVVVKTIASKYVKGEYANELNLMCPRCNRLHKMLDHAEQMKCQCGLRMQVFGAGLVLWE